MEEEIDASIEEVYSIIDELYGNLSEIDIIKNNIKDLKYSVKQLNRVIKIFITKENKENNDIEHILEKISYVENQSKMAIEHAQQVIVTLQRRQHYYRFGKRKHTINKLSELFYNLKKLRKISA